MHAPRTRPHARHLAPDCMVISLPVHARHFPCLFSSQCASSQQSSTNSSAPATPACHSDHWFMPDRPPHHASRLASEIHALQTAANSHGFFPHAPALIHQRSLLHSGQTTAVLSFTSWLPFPMHRPCIVSVISHAIAPMLPCPALAVWFLFFPKCSAPALKQSPSPCLGDHHQLTISSTHAPTVSLPTATDKLLLSSLLDTHHVAPLGNSQL